MFILKGMNIECVFIKADTEVEKNDLLFFNTIS
jgi:hypothetical protein